MLCWPAVRECSALLCAHWLAAFRRIGTAQIRKHGIRTAITEQEQQHTALVEEVGFGGERKGVGGLRQCDVRAMSVRVIGGVGGGRRRQQRRHRKPVSI